MFLERTLTPVLLGFLALGFFPVVKVSADEPRFLGETDLNELTKTREGKFEVVACARLPGQKTFGSNQPFRSAAIRDSWVYGLTRGVGFFDTGKLHVYKISKDQKKDKDADSTDSPDIDPVKVIDGVGDGQNLMLWDKYLICGRYGGLEVYSLEDPANPKRIAYCAPASKRGYRMETIVRDGNRAYLLGFRAILCYDLTDPTNPKPLMEQRIPYDIYGSCIVAGKLYVGGGKILKKGKKAKEEEGIAVFDAADPANLKEISFVKLSQAVYHVFAVSENRLLASMDDDSLAHYSSDNDYRIAGKSALIDISNPSQPVVVKEIPDSGGRVATVMKIKEETFFFCHGGIFAVRKDDLELVDAFFPVGSTGDGFPYHAANDGTTAALPLSNLILVLRKAKEE